MAIDWSAAHRRIEAIRVALEQGFTPTPVVQKQILKARAHALARQSTGGDVAAASIEVVEFLLAQEQYGIETLYVREVYPLNDLTPLPCTPPFVRGIINIRGRLLSVIDLKPFFELPEKGLTDLNKVIIVHTEAMELGILADAILGVRRLPLTAMQPSLPTLTGIREEYLKGVTQERVVILEARKLLLDNTILVHDEV